MDKIVKCRFHVSSRYINTDTEEIVDVVIPEGTPTDKEDDIIREWHEEWVWENIENYYEIIEDQ